MLILDIPHWIKDIIHSLKIGMEKDKQEKKQIGEGD